MAESGGNEIEIKLRVANPAEIEERLASLGFEITKPRVFEANTIFDDADQNLRSRGCLLRLREVGGRIILTFKGPPVMSKHKSREELETSMGDAKTSARIFERLGFLPTFRYEKYRTEFERPEEPGVATLDETPVGWFVELEGSPEWIDRTASELRYTDSDYVTESYATLYLKYCTENGVQPSSLTFDSTP